MVPLLHNIKGKNKATDSSRGLEIKTQLSYVLCGSDTDVAGSMCSCGSDKLLIGQL